MINIIKGGYRGGAEGAAAPPFFREAFLPWDSFVRSRHAYSQNIIS
jgi:hypothetical protein